MHFGKMARIAVVGFGAAMTVGLGSGVAMADMANGDPPVCAQTPDGGCVDGPPLNQGVPMPSDWVADQYSFVGTSYLGEDFYVRSDLANASATQLNKLARDLGYSKCRLVFVLNGPNEGACK